MIDQLIIGDRASFDDFRASLAKRSIKMPAKKSIKETIPFSNITYDFSAINGEVYWGERELEYIFEITASDPERLEELKNAFSDWVMNVFEEELHDPFIPDYHYIATYEDMNYEDEESLEKTTVSVVFTAYPYKIANLPKVYTFEVLPSSEEILTFLNESSHKVTPTINTDIGITIVIGSTTYSVSEGEVTDEALKLEKGMSTMTFRNPKGTTCSGGIITFQVNYYNSSAPDGEPFKTETYEADEGMTWEEWVNSDYNTEDACFKEVDYDDWLWIGGYGTYYIRVAKTDVIGHGQIYNALRY